MFTVPDTQAADGHQALPRDTDLARVLSIQAERTVQNDWTVRWQNGFLQLLRATAIHRPHRLQPGLKPALQHPWRGRRPPPRTTLRKGPAPLRLAHAHLRCAGPSGAEYHHKLRDISNGLQHRKPHKDFPRFPHTSCR